MAVPYFEVASGPALQWVRMPSPGLTSESPYSEMRRHIPISSSWMARHSRSKSPRISATLLSAAARAAPSMRRTAQARLTAVGREDTRYSPFRSSAARKAAGSSLCSRRASTYMP